MSDIVQFENPQGKKSFWKRPEGMTGMLFMAALILGGGYLIVANMAAILALMQNVLYLSLMLAALGVIVYMILDPKMRNLIWYMYKSVMRSITGMFVQLDPIGILKSYVEDLEDNLKKMRKQIGLLRGQMRKIQGMMEKNSKDITNNLQLAAAARDKGKDQQMVLSSRRAARLKETNQKYQVLYNKMEVMYRILTKMHQNSEILLEDTRDQVKLKEQERKAIRASHSAMKSAMSVISGDPDKRAMFDMAMENITEDVANKVGEMERFMEMSASFMDSVDLQNGVFEEQGMAMLEEWEQKSTLMLMDGSEKSSDSLDLNDSFAQPEKRTQSSGSSSYDNLFE
ncbi:hypothetical protein [Flavilitoribacter nigricans]|uniref:Uncharacterized protein n=1 Tax=Flavilitoribacter nigricans (strain ATCC 23147 / DSM 23189 / NBRC 102662 / NCIMB 1420 / SS-2) TaxID=1122177 RepID=A0A2D0MZH2_FLAN2|nr:hypothetical protein [Flavilitoribacter nigricans]PHN01528.1 hypothetical protein CRP01_36630 [Flavilitoribacter nigricans DSM 23189 = NBRC 102662]